MIMMMMMMSGCRISPQLLEYYPYRQFGICSSISSNHSNSNNNNNSNNKYGRFVSCKKKGLRPHLTSFCFRFNYAPSSNIFLGGGGGSGSCATNSSGSGSCRHRSCGFSSEDLGGVSFFQQQRDDTSQPQPQPPVLSHCLSPAENGGRDTVGLSSVTGGIVALGKFDALHIGHRELAIQAAKIGLPFLLSFVGMAEILGWEPRAPIVAKCDRKRVLSSWAPFCGNVTPKEFHVDFSKVRYLTPQQFVKKLADELGVLGVVAGQNYRFGYKAAGDASDLLRLCNEYGMRACIINSVMDKKQDSRGIGSSNAKEQGQVSSTRVRHALANGDMKYVSELLGRHHRLMVMVKNKEKMFRDRGRISAPRSCLLNLPPKEGQYRNCSLVIDDRDTVVPCGVIIDKVNIHLELDDELARRNITDDNNIELLGIDFSDSKD